MADKTTKDLIKQLGSFETRAEARKKLMELDPCPVDALLAILGDPALPLNQRWAAMTILGNAKAEEAIPTILEVMRNESNLTDESAKALGAITGRDCGLMVEDWEQELGVSGTPDPQSAEEPAPSPDPPVKAAIDDDQWLPTLIKEAVGERAESVDWDEGGYVHTKILLEGREQQVLVAPGEVVGLPPDQIMVYTECGVIPKESATPEFLQSLPSPPLGELDTAETENGISLTLRHVTTAVGLTAGALGTTILDLAKYADSLEEQLTGKDRV